MITLRKDQNRLHSDSFFDTAVLELASSNTSFDRLELRVGSLCSAEDLGVGYTPFEVLPYLGKKAVFHSVGDVPGCDVRKQIILEEQFRDGQGSTLGITYENFQIPSEYVE